MRDLKDVCGTRTAAGSLPGFAWPGGYPVLYMTKNDDTLCASCASKWQDEDVKAFIHWEGYPEQCDECGREVDSAYGPIQGN